MTKRKNTGLKELVLARFIPVDNISSQDMQFVFGLCVIDVCSQDPATRYSCRLGSIIAIGSTLRDWHNNNHLVVSYDKFILEIYYK